MSTTAGVQSHNERPAAVWKSGAKLRRGFIAFHDCVQTELVSCVPGEYLLTIDVRR